MNDDIRAALGVMIAPPMVGFSIFSLAEKIQPVISVIGTIIGIVVSILAAAYYVKKLKEK